MSKRLKFLLNIALVGFALGRAYNAWQRRQAQPHLPN
jgi:hypothetical protein